MAIALRTIVLAEILNEDWGAFISSPNPSINIETIPAKDPTPPIVLSLRSSNIHGLGLHAAQRIPKNTVILRERPIIKATQINEQSQINIANLTDLEIMLYKSLRSDSHSSIEPIFRTYSGEDVVFGLASRFNHGCPHIEKRQNVEAIWDSTESNEMEFITLAEVQMDDELLVDYNFLPGEELRLLGRACICCLERPRDGVFRTQYIVPSMEIIMLRELIKRHS